MYNMKKNWKNNILLVTVVLFLLLLAGCNRHRAGHDEYTCPMHPTVLSDKPGACPVCGMELVRKAQPGEEIKMTNDLANISVAPSQSIASSVRTIKPEYKSVPFAVEAAGVVTYDPRKIYTIASRVGGRIEKMYLKYEFQNVTKGQKIAEIYSPELITAQRELLYLNKNDGESTLIEAARNKLALLGLPSSQIKAIEKNNVIGNTFSIYSPYNGYVITNDGSQPGVRDMEAATDGMDRPPSPGSTTAVNANDDLRLREGHYVSAGQTLVKVVNSDALRVELNVSQGQYVVPRPGDKISLNLGNENMVTATIEFVQPFFSEGQNFLNIRVYVNNSQKFVVGQIVRANLEFKSRESLWVSKQAVLDLGIDKIVFRQRGKIFQPAKITTGISTGDLVEVKSGLATTDEIAFDAHFLVDSESFIKPID